MRGFTTATALAKDIDVDLATISNMENDKVKDFPSRHLLTLAHKLEVTADYLLGEEDADLEVSDALVNQSFRLFLRKFRDSIPFEMEETLLGVSRLTGAPQTVEDWTSEYHKLQWVLERERQKWEKKSATEKE